MFADQWPRQQRLGDSGQPKKLVSMAEGEQL
jgi:hypothetical protein